MRLLPEPVAGLAWEDGPGVGALPRPGVVLGRASARAWSTADPSGPPPSLVSARATSRVLRPAPLGDARACALAHAVRWRGTAGCGSMGSAGSSLASPGGDLALAGHTRPHGCPKDPRLFKRSVTSPRPNGVVPPALTNWEISVTPLTSGDYGRLVCCKKMPSETGRSTSARPVRCLERYSLPLYHDTGSPFRARATMVGWYSRWAGSLSRCKSGKRCGSARKASWASSRANGAPRQT